QLNIKIPPGVDNGSRLKLRGEGESGPGAATAGDLYIVLHVRDHPLFAREGTDVVCEVPMSFTQAALGADIQVPTLEGAARVAVVSSRTRGLRRLRDVGEHAWLAGWIRRLGCDDRGAVVVGPGDDAAVVRVGRRPLVLTTDTLVEGVHFRRGWIRPARLGRR